MKSIAKLVKQHMAALLLLAVALTMSAGTLWAKYVTSLPVTTGLTLKVTLEYSIDKAKMNEVLKLDSLSDITSLNFVTGSAVPEGATKVTTSDTTSGIQADGSGPIYLYRSGTTAYIAPANSNDSTSVIYAPVDCSSFLWGGSLSMVAACTAYDLSNLDTSRTTDMSHMFQGDTNGTNTKIQTITFGSHFATDKVTTMLRMFAYQKSLTSLDLSGFNTKSVTTMEAMFSEDDSLATVTLGKDFKFVGTNGYLPGSAWYDQSQGSSAATMTPAQVATCQNSATGAITYVSTKPTEETTKTATLNAEAVWGNLIYASGDDDDDGAAHVKFVSAAPVGLTAYEDDGTKINLAGDNDDSDPIYMYYDKSSDTVYIAAENNSTIYAPVDCSHLFDTSDFRSDSSSGTGMTALTTISLEALDTSNVTNMDSMFANCKSLTTIYVNTFDTSKVTSSAGMFSDCEDLVGGSNTGWNKDNTNDVTYACVDGGTSNPGYFTAYTATTSTTSDTASDTTDASDTVTNVTNSYTIDTTALTGVTARQTTDEEETTNEN